MKDEFTNWLASFQTSHGTLTRAEFKAVWFQQPPLIFTTKVTDAIAATSALEDFCRAQSTGTGGDAKDKAREEGELEVAAHTLGRTLVQWFRDQHDEANAAKVDLELTNWRQLRDQLLLEKAKLARDLAQGVVSGPKATDAAGYSIDAAAVQALSKEIEDYTKVLTAPQQAIGNRKSLTLQMRARFNAVEAKFESLDNMILQFNKTAAGRALIAAYQAARIVRDLGHGPGEDKPAPPTPPSP